MTSSLEREWRTEDAAAQIERLMRPGDGVVWGQGIAQPRLLSQALLVAAQRVEGLRIFTGMGHVDLDIEALRRVGFVSYCGAGNNRLWQRQGVLDILPTAYSSLPVLMGSGAIGCDVVMLLLPPPDANGYCSMGLAADYLVAALRRARVVLAEINPNVPATCGPHRIHVDDLHLRIESHYDMALESPSAPSAEEELMADLVAELVEDGATLQLGIGQIPEKIAQRLRGKRDLGVHSGVIGDAIMQLARNGTITNARKGVDAGHAVTGLVMGSRALLEHVNGNPAVQLMETAYTHSIDVMARLHRFTSINSALEVDLTGQVNAESVGGRYAGAVGGMADFARGARASVGGRSIVALPASAGDRSRIVVTLQGPTTLARSDVDHIVTEYGVAHLRGLSLKARVQRMIEIAHPDIRESLARQAHGRSL